jgi:hypothetical protein
MKGEVKKFNFNARTLDDSAVKDGLEAVGVLNEKEPYFLVGGIATQSYLPTRCRRPTSDIDFALVRPLSKPDFRQMIIPVREFLHDTGYETAYQTSNRSRSYALYYFSPSDTSDVLCLEFVRRNKKNFEKHKKRLEREFDNAREKIVEERNSTYRVCNPEDIAVPKLVRLIGTLSRNPKFMHYAPSKLESFSDEEVERRISSIADVRAEAVANPGDPLLAEKLRFISDIYDIRILSEIAGFNPEYFKKAEQDWYNIDKHSELRDKIFLVALPAFLEKTKRK